MTLHYEAFVSGRGTSSGSIEPTLYVYHQPRVMGTGVTTGVITPNASWQNAHVNGRGTGFASIREAPIDWINRPRQKSPPAEVDFNWSPVSAPYSWVVGSRLFIPAQHYDLDGDYSTNSTYYETEVGEEITFTAAAELPRGRVAGSYFWDFGDGVTALGNPVAHTYVAPNPYGRVILKITDTEGDEYFQSKRIYVVPTESIPV